MNLAFEIHSNIWVRQAHIILVNKSRGLNYVNSECSRHQHQRFRINIGSSCCNIGSCCNYLILGLNQLFNLRCNCLKLCFHSFTFFLSFKDICKSSLLHASVTTQAQALIFTYITFETFLTFNGFT